MANTFKRKFSGNIGNTANQLGSYTVAANTTAVVVGLSVVNTTGSAIAANVFLSTSSANVNLVVSAPISSGSSLVLVGGDQKLVMETGDSIYVQGSVASSCDAIMSIMEIT